MLATSLSERWRILKDYSEEVHTFTAASTQGDALVLACPQTLSPAESILLSRLSVLSRANILLLTVLGYVIT
jgi:hypothetical protein